MLHLNLKPCLLKTNYDNLTQMLLVCDGCVFTCTKRESTPGFYSNRPNTEVVKYTYRWECLEMTCYSVIPQERAGAESTDQQNKSEFNPVAGIHTNESGNTLFYVFMPSFLYFFFNVIKV